MTNNNLFAGPQISVWLSIALIVFGLVLAFKGQVDLLLGAYLATSWQMPPVLDLNVTTVSVIWGLVPLIGVATWRRYRENHSQVLDRSSRRLLVWLACWAIWIGTLTLAFPPASEDLQTLVSILALHLAVPLTVLALFADDVQWVRRFALAFVVVNVMMLPHTLTTLFAVPNLMDVLAVLDQPWWRASGIYVNYHAFGQVGAVSLLFIVALIMDKRLQSWLVKGLLVVALGLMAYLLVISGSRQYIFGVLLVAPVLGLWLLRGRLQQKWLFLLSLAIILVIVLGLFTYVPDYFRLSELAVGEDETGYLASRPAIYAQMWEWWLKSPLFGNGFFYEYRLSHNLFLDALAAEGLPGFVFLLGLLYFFVQRMRGTWRGSPHDSVAIWRMMTLMIFAVGFISANVSGSVLTADVMYTAGTLIWCLERTAQRRAADGQRPEVEAVVAHIKKSPLPQPVSRPV